MFILIEKNIYSIRLIYKTIVRILIHYVLVVNISSKMVIFRKKIEGLRFRGEYTKAIQLIDDYQRRNVFNEEEKLILALDKCKILLKSGKYAGALLAIEELIRMCEEKCFPTLIIDAKLMKIDALEKSDRESEALTLLDEIEDYLAAHKEISNPERKRCFSEILYYRGSIHWQLSNLDTANVFLRKSIAIKKELEDKESLAIALTDWEHLYPIKEN